MNIDLTGKSMNRIVIDHKSAIELWDTVAHIVLRLEGKFSLRLDSVEHLVDPENLADISDVLALMGKPLHRIEVDDGMPLTLSFEEDITLTVEPDPDYEWFNLLVGDSFQVHGKPGGNLMVFH
jgi:hypothetical protein